MTTLERIRLKEGLVNKLLSITRTTELLNYWTDTNGKPHDEIETLVRVCIMDEMERRFPKEYAEWRNDDADNDKLSFYLL